MLFSYAILLPYPLIINFYKFKLRPQCNQLYSYLSYGHWSFQLYIFLNWLRAFRFQRDFLPTENESFQLNPFTYAFQICLIHLCLVHVCLVHVCLVFVCLVFVCLIHVCLVFSWKINLKKKIISKLSYLLPVLQ